MKNITLVITCVIFGFVCITTSLAKEEEYVVDEIIRGSNNFHINHVRIKCGEEDEGNDKAELITKRINKAYKEKVFFFIKIKKEGWGWNKLNLYLISPKEDTVDEFKPANVTWKYTSVSIKTYWVEILVNAKQEDPTTQETMMAARKALKNYPAKEVRFSIKD